MPNENKPNQDHWKDLVKSLDLDVDFDDETPAEEEKSEDSVPLQEEKATSDVIAKESAASQDEEPLSSSKADPLFDLGWNNPSEEKVESDQQEKVEAAKAQTPEEPPVKKPKKPRKKKESRGFGFGLLPDEMFADEQKEESAEPETVASEPEETTIEFEPELTFADEGSIQSEPVAEEPLSEKSTKEINFGDDAQVEDDSEGASDWMALAAQLGVPIRSTEELQSEETSVDEEAKPEEAVYEDHFVDEETGQEYDPLAAWESPAPTGFRRSKDKPRQKAEPPVDFRDEIEADVAEQEDEPTMIGKPKEDTDKPKKERRRGRRRGRRRDREQEVESVEVTEEEETTSENEETDERSSKDRRRRRSRKNRKPVAESKDLKSTEDTDEDLDLDDFEEEESGSKKSGRQPKAHRGIPSWEEAIGLVVDKNLGTRNGRSEEQRSSRSRGGRGRSRRGGSRSKD